MTDIAMFVAEEYERRVKNSRKCGNGDEKEEVDQLFSGVSTFLAKRVEGWSNWNVKSIKLIGNGDYMKEMIPNPKSQIGVAAINGLFSA